MRQRTSPQRQTILRMVKFTSRPLTSAEIRQALPKLAEATIFRNLGKLVRNGEIYIVDEQDGQRRYTGHAHHEAVFTCQRCGHHRRLRSRTLDDYVQRKMPGMQIIYTSRLTAQGLCRSCAKEIKHGPH
jgi:Fe2+ or Zn2+ uptake regulation protein